jgi:dTDP-4-dehydrorhamnose reductase
MNRLVVIFGSNGMLGTYCKLYLSQYFNIIAITRNEYDITTTDTTKLDKLLKSIFWKYPYMAKYVINCAGLIPQRKNITDSDVISVNSVFPTILNRLCRKYGSRLIHISSDCVFDGRNGNYSEDDEPNEKGLYGWSKYSGEMPNMMIIRTSIIGEEINNKVSLLEWVKSNKNKTINGYKNHLWNGVTCLELAKQLKILIMNFIEWDGVYHMFSPNTVSKYELIKLINDTYDLNITINEMNTEVPINKTLTTKYKGFNIPMLQDQIKELYEFKIDLSKTQDQMKG